MKAFESHQHEKKWTEKGRKNDLRPDGSLMIGKTEELPPVSSKPWKNPTEKSEKRGLTTQLIDISRDKSNFTRPNNGEKSEFSDDTLEWQKWPILDERALFGFAGEFVRLATEESEADPAAVLMTFITRFGVECGTNPFLMVGDTRHYARVFSVIVGKSSKARKGTSGKPVNRLFDLASAIHKHPELSRIGYETARISPGPLSTGEGLIYAVRDKSEVWSPKKADHVLEDPGVNDKRLFVLDEEFGSALSCTKREGNTLSTILRCAWDDGTIEPLTKTSRTKATGAHIGICTHITLSELHKKLNETEAFNGFANRFLWCCARRSKYVPLPEPMPEDRLSLLQMKLVDIISKAQSYEQMFLGGFAKEMWETVYSDLSKDVDGLIGSVTARAEAQVYRLSMIYALLDGQRFITQGHLEAALTLWRYCEESAKYIFFHRETNPHARKILKALKDGPKSTTALYKIFSRRIKKYDMDKVLRELVDSGRIEPFQEKTGGKPKTLFRMIEYHLKGKKDE